MTYFSEKILPITLKHEGGKVNHPSDPGGKTNMGITQRTYNAYRKKKNQSPKDVYSITKKEVAAIYKTEYWDAVNGRQLLTGLDLSVFDAGVNSGPSRAIKWLQQTIRVPIDGKIGPITMDGVLSITDRVPVIVKYNKTRMGFLQRLRHWEVFKKGWTRRVADIEAKSVGLVSNESLKKQLPQIEKEKQQGDAGAAGGGAGAAVSSLFDLPQWALLLLISLLLLGMIGSLFLSYKNRIRIKAYKDEIERLKNVQPT